MNAVSHSTLGIVSAFATPQDPKSNSNLYLSVWVEKIKRTEKRALICSIEAKRSIILIFTRNGMDFTHLQYIELSVSR